MKKMFNKKWLAALMMGAALFSACTDDALMEAPQVQEESKDTYVATITAKLPETTVGSRLAFENGTHNGKNAVLTKWEADDKVAVNVSPANEGYTYLFTLKSGAGTNTAVFENASMPDYNTDLWTLYYPGDKIKCEKDYLYHSYTGQTQQGNNSLAHLEDYHTIRYVREYDAVTKFQDEMIDFSGDGFEESLCMKFNLSGFTSAITPTKLELMYLGENGSPQSIFYTYNFVSPYYIDNPQTYVANAAKEASMTLNLSGFSATKSITAYMMMSNATMSVKQGGKFRVYVTATGGAKYFGDVAIKDNVDMKGGNLYSITCKSWKEMDKNDAFVNPSAGVTVLHEATQGNGTDIIIMGDGFSKTHFSDGNYAKVMKQAYDDFFSVEPYASLKDYFNVYYVNAVSEEDHDAVPDQYNGATQGDAVTVFNTQLEVNSTFIGGNNAMVLEYAKQAIRTRGGKNGAAVSDEDEVYRRANTALMMVQVNVKAHAGTCHGVITSASDYGSSYSVAYTALGTSDYGRIWTTIHEAGGHGFGKLADEYEQKTYTLFDVASWTNLDLYHSWGYDRNVDEYWNPNSERLKYKENGEEKLVTIEWRENDSSTWPSTDGDNVYWKKLLSDDYAYKNTLQNNGKEEGLGVHEGGYTYYNFYCRPTDNSVMRSQFDTNGNFFNAISRWTIWYRVMKLTGTKSYTSFESSLNDFITFDNGLTIVKDLPGGTRSVLDLKDLKPLAPPVMKKGQWINGRLVLE